MTVSAIRATPTYLKRLIPERGHGRGQAERRGQASYEVQRECANCTKNWPCIVNSSKPLECFTENELIIIPVCLLTDAPVFCPPPSHNLPHLRISNNCNSLTQRQPQQQQRHQSPARSRDKSLSPDEAQDPLCTDMPSRHSHAPAHGGGQHRMHSDHPPPPLLSSSTISQTGSPTPYTQGTEKTAFCDNSLSAGVPTGGGRSGNR